MSARSSLTGSELLRACERLGCAVVRSSGGHVILQAPGGQRFPLGRHTRKQAYIREVSAAARALGVPISTIEAAR